MWRESLLPRGCEAAPKSDSPFLPDIPQAPDYDDCVAEREQAPRHGYGFHVLQVGCGWWNCCLE
ncbi:hypothetical protein PS941_04077 [Pseudomonas fluorescens]|uniref:Uncharacterized protein n=1 Tax=Pseudomonas fluorescens TaxID=294 RepID=A0A5E7UTX2_PSEFL|nr:hypothetical protein PS941_04077 [Pseudomonas fluorescens]